MCVDYKALNKITMPNRDPIPRIDDLLDKLQGSKVFTSLDLCSAYQQVKLNEADYHKTAFGHLLDSMSTRCYLLVLRMHHRLLCQSSMK
jgi:hypothetical protein